jgi:hypothetical protein
LYRHPTRVPFATTAASGRTPVVVVPRPPAVLTTLRYAAVLPPFDADGDAASNVG